MLATLVRDRQPVEFQLREHFVEAFARRTSVNEGFDPEGRDAMIHCGAAVEHLKLTLRRHGCFGRAELFPDIDQPDLAARVYLGGGGARNDFERQLFKALELDQDGFRVQAPISEAAVNWLSLATNSERSWLEFARSDGSRHRLLELFEATQRMRAMEVQLRDETLVRSPDGGWRLVRFTSEILKDRFGRWRKPTVALKVQVPTPSREPFDSIRPAVLGGTLGVLKTKTDDKRGWLAAGQTLAQSLLHARNLGLPCASFIDLLRSPEHRALLRTAIGHKGFTQVILHFDVTRVKLFPQPEMDLVTAARLSV